MIKHILFGLTLLSLTSVSAFAQDKLGSDTFSPEHCSFTASFPEEPTVVHDCENPEDPNTCYNLVSYTKVFDLNASVRVDIICNPATPAMYEDFDEKTMRDTVRAMTQGTVIEAYEVGSRQAEHYRQAGLLGKGRKGMDDTMYIAQLWIDEKSIMSVEAELIGEQRDDADQIFADILRTIGYKSEIEGKEEAPAEGTAQVSKPDQPAP